MRKFTLLLLVVLLLGSGLPIQPARAQGGSELPPDVASYKIEVRYDPETHRLKGRETIVYNNRTDQPIPDLVFHLYLNAFRSMDTVWMQEDGGQHRGFVYDSTQNGWMEIQKLEVGGQTLELEQVGDDDTLMRADLPAAVAPGKSVEVEVEFTGQLPKVFARTGWADNGDFVLAGQWFPKLGVWQQGAWNAYNFHANSEFYADFGSYDVALTLPEDWVVGTTTGNAPVIDEAPQTNGDGTVTHQFHAGSVIDFVWAASPKFKELQQTVNGVDIRVLYPPEKEADALRIIKATVEGMQKYNEWYGTYAMGNYPNLTVIVVPADGGGAGGMEYPSLFTVGALGAGPACFKVTEVETVHELGHQWFQSVVATNEAEEAWLDEGFTDYITLKAMEALYNGAMSDCGGINYSYAGGERRLAYIGTARGVMDTTALSMNKKAWDYEGMEYGVIAYAKPAISLKTLENLVGEEAMLKFMSTYYQRYAFKHPTGADVRAVMAETLGKDWADWYFTQVVESGATLDAQVTELEGNQARVVREGRQCVPLTVRVTYQGGESDLLDWPCSQTQLHIAGERTILGVEIDPEDKVLLDINPANNSLHSELDWAVWLSLVARSIHSLQNLFFWGGASW